MVAREGDWICTSCRNHNYASRTVCNIASCGQPKPAVGALDATIHSSVAVNQPSGRRGDPANWFCPMCNNENFPSRSHCNKKECNFPRFQNGSAPPAAQPGATAYAQLMQLQQQQQSVHQIMQQQAAAQAQAGGASHYGASAPPVMQYAQMMSAQINAAQAPAQKLYNPRPGDWLCPMCNNHNYASREVCNGPGCSQPKPMAPHAIIGGASLNGAQQQTGYAPPPKSQQRRVGDWVCPLCQNLNYASREICNGPGCQQAKVNSMRWLCPVCQNDNYPHREKCNKQDCQAPRPANPELVNDKFDAMIGGKKRSKAGDPDNWMCELCGNENFPSRTECNIPTCRNPRDSAQKRMKMEMGHHEPRTARALAGTIGGLI